MSTWRELLGREHRAPMIVMAGGVALFAINVYLTTSLLPSAVADIGGEDLYAWTMTVFLVVSVISSMLVSRWLSRFGARRSYVFAFALFAAGTVVAGASPTMTVMLVGRALQGFGAGLLGGLGFSVIRLVLPPSLWQRSIALMSAMWGVGNFVGPVVGGFFAQIHFWRGAFGLLALFAAGLIALTLRALPARGTSTEPAGPVPWVSLTLLTVAVGAVSVASLVHGGVTWILMSVAAIGGAAFIVWERRASSRVLPEMTYRGRSPLRWIYLAIVVLAAVSTIETFLPLFGQRIGGLGPLAAGFLGAAISWGWTVASISASGIDGERGRRAVRLAGPLVLGIGLILYGVLQMRDPSVGVIVAWYGVLFFGGCGIGMAMAHWFTAGLRVTDDEVQAAQASAGLNTSQLIANASGSALAGLLVSLGGPDIVGSARTLSFGFAALAFCGIAVALREFTVARRWRAAAAEHG
ncbi:MFS transporter [Gordonia neofelifaecis]|uniref:Multidrug ABC transporter n=1 Tax=Gordonia neofelifaecis NRRL B-59395 TaxID=644548 RepID=F1YG00_9ACTN|nr:MFS transporter [Gordonia neofelifaecis]EGD56577.1 multidrug ABC transporter [Gordonia neofelifaecis NRRL B-59395]